MKNQNSFNPYMQNIRLLRNFFSKPLTLFTAIAFAILSIYQLAIAPILKHTNNFSINFISIMISIALFLLYFKSKSKKTYTSFSAPTLLLKIVSIISIIINVFSILYLFCMIFLLFSLNRNEIFSSSLFKTILAVLIPLIALETTFSISMLLFAGSINKSSKSIYMYGKGSAAFGVSALIKTIAILCFIIIYLFFLPQISSWIFDALYPVIKQSALSGNYNIYKMFSESIRQNYLTFDIYNVIGCVINVSSYFLLSILALSYNRFIRLLNLTIHINSDNNYYDKKSDLEIPNPPSLQKQPVSFRPQNVTFKNEPDQPLPINNQNNDNLNLHSEKYNNSSDASKTQEEPQNICPSCNCVNHPKAIFCGKCGEKIK